MAGTEARPTYESVNHKKCRVGTAHHQKQESIIVMDLALIPYSVIASPSKRAWQSRLSCIRKTKRRDCRVADSKRVIEAPVLSSSKGSINGLLAMPPFSVNALSSS
jgi:hypothetical protein